MQRFHRLPLDGQLYRLIWAGRISQPRTEQATPRIHLWLARIDESSPENLRCVLRPSGLPEVMWLEESAGSVAMFPIGSFWRDGVRQERLHALPEDQKFQREVLSAQSWGIVSSNDPIGNGFAKHVNRSDYPLSGENDRGEKEFFYDGFLIRCTTDSGLTLLIPCYEIFRRFFAVSSEISNALLSGHWATELKKLVQADRTGVSPDGKSYTIWPRGQMSDIAALALARFGLIDVARAAAASVYLELENARNRERRNSHWIVARPPWADDSIRISFLGQRLSNDTVLVLRIAQASFPSVPMPVSIAQEHLVIPKLKLTEDTTNPKAINRIREDDEDEQTHIGGPEDARYGQRVTQIPMDDPWDDVPRVKRTYVRETEIEREISSVENQQPRNRFVSTGKRGSHGSLSRGSFNPDEHTAIQSRFHALSTCFQEMIEHGDLQSRRDYDLVDPRTTELASYCQFPIEIGGAPQSWALVPGTQSRPRLCWVSELVSADGFVSYWLEIEPVRRITQKYLLLKPRTPGNSLSASTLRSILKAAVVRSGVWSADTLRTVHDEVIWIAKRHSYQGASLRRLGALAALKELRRKHD